MTLHTLFPADIAPDAGLYLSAWARGDTPAAASTARLEARIEELDSSAKEIGRLEGSLVPVPSTWTEIQAAGAVMDGGVKANPWVFVYDTGGADLGGACILVDDLQFVQQ